MKKLLLIIFLLNIVLADTLTCKNKNFLLQLLNEDATWYPIETNIKNGYSPFNAIKVKQGGISVRTPKSDFILRYVGIDDSLDGFKHVVLQNIKHYRSEISQKYVKYFDKKLILTPYKDCSLKTIKLEIYSSIIGKNTERILFKKNTSNVQIANELKPISLKYNKNL